MMNARNISHLFKTDYLLKNALKITKVVRALRGIDFLCSYIDSSNIRVLNKLDFLGLV